MAEDLRTLHTAINNILANKSQPLLGALKTRLIAPQELESPSPVASVAPSPLVDHALEAILDAPIKESNPVEPLNQVPINTLYEITRLTSLRSHQLSPLSLPSETSAPMRLPQDLVSEGKLDVEDAERLTQAFLHQTDHYLYSITGRFEDLQSIRLASSLLFTAICTVSALHEPQGESLFYVCSSELRRLVSNFVFTTQVSIDDFQGLCIASFWLSDLSWSISGLAVRRAMEFQLAKSFDFIVGDMTAPAQAGSRHQFSNAEDALYCLRVWYLFYICDRHLSILYGRPSTFGDEISVTKWQMYLDAISATSTDVRLASQLDLLLILDNVTRLFGTKVDVRIPVNFQSRLERFIHQIDQWMITWSCRYGKFSCNIQQVTSLTLTIEPHDRIGSFPAKALTLHYHFAKLLVSSHVFRGRSSEVDKSSIPAEFHELGLVAIQNARDIMNLITRDSDIRAGFVAMPHYYHTMVAYACSFMLKLATNSRNHLGIDQDDVFHSILQVTELCQSIQCTRYHIVYWMGSGLRGMTADCQKVMAGRLSNYQNDGQQMTESDSGRDAAFSTEQPHQDMDVNEWDVVRQAATDRAEFAPDGPSLTNGRPGTEATMSLPGMGSIGFQSEWEALLPSFNFEHMGLGLL
ncbi:hypothetical protein NM208_g9493 [Fusarium decemcellulare]|uniref:Uncharacterized protein n=1 Tax=Fusarium decemcellulare TaxID=57161 RepID=A0ACC1S1H5_9HYPO|nr:hypothetical protein NM208_g9493 [Fusarium decemcellulare]